MQEVANMQAIVTAALVEQTEALDTISANVLGCHKSVCCSVDIRATIVLKWWVFQVFIPLNFPPLAQILTFRRMS